MKLSIFCLEKKNIKTKRKKKKKKRTITSRRMISAGYDLLD